MWQDVKNIYHLFVALFANLWFGFPGRKLTVIGVTGTDGKTTTVHLIHHILTQVGKNASMVSSIGAVINGKEHDTGLHVTTPSPFALQRLLQSAARGPAGRLPRSTSSGALLPAGARRGSPAPLTPRSFYFVLEVTSHAIDQNRIWGIPFSVGVLTNVTEEHLDYHKDYEDYVRTKMKLLEAAKVAVVNRDDRAYSFIKSEIRNSTLRLRSGRESETNSKIVTYGMKKGADVNTENFPFKTKLVGEFNRYNVLAAVATCRVLGLSDREVERGIASFTPPAGRTELVYKNNFSVIIDFAHTPNAIEQLLCSIRPAVKGRLIHVFGSAGERDRQKRPKMGHVAAKYADVVILTAEDPRSEPVESIINQIESGMRNQELGNVRKIPDRQEAINEAMKMARSGDVVVITGKGHERSMNLGHGEEPWNEHGAVRKALSARARGPVSRFPPASARSSLASSNELRAVGNLSTAATPRTSYEKN